ncbi:MAG TPA: hypothetical protein VJR58_26745 [Vineibacter sp.]|nr:hypothetical protein [Vineibacter sp.]
MSNVRTVILTALMTLVALAPSGGVARDPARAHDFLLAVALLYLVLHGGMLLHVRRLSEQGDDASIKAASLLRDPHRISSLDLAAYWTALATLGSSLRY